MTALVDAPARADGLQLLGTMVGSGYRTPPALVRRGDGQTLQLTPLLYAVLDAIDGHSSPEEVAARVRERVRREVTPEVVATLVDQQLRPLGLLKLADGSEPALKRSDPLLGLKMRFKVTDPASTRRITDPFRILFRPTVMGAVVLAFLAVTGWVFFRHGLGPAAYDAFERPHLLLLVFVVTVLSGGFHEFGHAAAARYGGAVPGVIGAGLYLVWPAFYTDVTDSYRLPRAGRLRTDLGGLYFNAVVVVLTFVGWRATGWDALLLLVATQVLQMVQQLMPLLRFDGYHVLADLTGVPDLYQRIRPTLLGLLPHHWRDDENRVLKPWARVVITAWVLVTVPLMAFMLFTLVKAFPRLVGSAWSAVGDSSSAVGAAWSQGDPVDVAAQVVQVLAVVLPVVAGGMILGRLVLRWSTGLVAWSRGSVGRRAAAVALVAAVAIFLSFAWAPRPGAYRPIGPDEKGLLTAALPGAATGPAVEAAPAASASVTGAAAERRLAGSDPLAATFGTGERLPTKAKPRLAMVLVPSDTGDAGDASGAGEGAEQPWVFPFDRPLPPSQGDNQALAVNTRDDSVSYDVAFALVWAEGDEVLQVNEARAYASCSNCVTVAVAFQVVLVMDDARVIVPQNLAVAANYDCYRCITAAIANQLVLSVGSEPGEEQLLALGEVWGRLTELGRTITSYPLAEVAARLEGFKAEIVAILGSAPPVAAGTASATASSSPSPSSSSASSATAAPESPRTSPQAPGSTAPSGSPSSEPSASSGTTTQAPAPSSPADSSAPTDSRSAPATSSTAPTP
ncbi:hypothetical protein ASG49_06905 [Marmoricola sp. Leaf446]|uniref:hypothetical protein n=1 Tax=Marmoricola sp. Leaf446 TaxID=1736379 RepID=UPI0006FBCFA9|nr:hypothetical protein [Marmoricola sp. Leaf446]KQT94576.1 hypothetical protein ASG49_06905 [Marmoricola sp. Leaf446]